MIDTGRSTPSASPPAWLEQAARYFWDERGSFGTERERGQSAARRGPRHRHTCGAGTVRVADPGGASDTPPGGPSGDGTADPHAGTR